MFSVDLKPGENLAEAILKTIVFFDLFDYPLTPVEIYHYLDKKFSLLEISEEIKASQALARKNGFYFLNGREEIITLRQKKHNYSVRKFKIAKRFANLFSVWPFVKVIALANSIGQHNLRDGSDIDFFIISAPRRIWLTRLFCTGLAKLLNRRPSAKKKKDKLCLSFYLSEEHLDLADLKLPVYDPYFEYWQRSLVLLYNKEGAFERFLKINLGQGAVTSQGVVNREVITSSGALGNFLEKIARQWQLKIMAPELKQARQSGPGVVINDQVLKLYLTDRRQEFLDKYEKKLQQLFS